jgi:pseudaminic acid biosynthesis-associated methylase
MATQQLDAWTGKFGDDYVERNNMQASNLKNQIIGWSRILGCLPFEPPKSILEVGANIGHNLRALSHISDAALYAIEPNDKARGTLSQSGFIKPQNVIKATAFDIPLADNTVEMAFTSGVLIHIAPENLLKACSEMHRVASKYIVCREYFATEPEAKNYRGHDGLLFKRDFGGFWLDNFPDLELVDYGFQWYRVTGLGDLTWWVFRKR